MSSKYAETESVLVEIPVDSMERAIKAVGDFYKRETGRAYPEWAIVKAIKNVFEERIEVMSEDISELLTSPSSDESFLFRRYLEESLESVQVFDAVSDVPNSRSAAPHEQSNVFNGFRPFSADRLSAMAGYIASRGKEIYKTKLNKLLFYADFVNYYVNGSSISGSRYVHLPYGPVPESYEALLNSAATSGEIRLEPAGTDAVLIKPGESDPARILTSEEMATLDWVIDSYGPLSTNAISELSHREKAYRFTKQGECIAYAYAKFFERLP